MKKILSLFLSLVLVFSLVACSNNNTGTNGESESESGVLNVQFVPTNNDGTMQAKAEPFARYLSEKLGREVKVTLATDYSTIVEAMASGQVDLGIMPPAAYVQARGLKAAEALLTSVLGGYNDETGEPEDQTSGAFRAEILVRADSDIQTFEDLRGKKIATLSPTSASGYIYPVAELKGKGLDLTKESTLTPVNDIPSEITSVLNGQQDAAFSFEGTRYVFNGIFDEDLPTQLRVLYLTEAEIPNDAIAVNPKMSQELKDKIVEVFKNMNQDEEGKEAMSMWSHQGYTDAVESNYDTVEQYTNTAAE